MLSSSSADAFSHLVGGLIGEGDGQDGTAGHALLDQMGDAIGDDARLAGARAGQNEDRTVGGEDSFTLLRIQAIQIIHWQKIHAGLGPRANAF